MSLPNFQKVYLKIFDQNDHCLKWYFAMERKYTHMLQKITELIVIIA